MTIRLTLAILFLSLCALSASAQESHNSAQTSVPADSRFEIIQSDITAKATFRLDKFTGQIHQMVMNAKGDTLWQLMTKVANPEDTIRLNGKVNYQLFTSGIVVRDTFLININTGATWKLFADSDDNEMYWAPMK